ncbi:aromatic compound catabolic protein [Companilactobacillus sp. HBUAS56275]|uniref:Aromatic compound catabolic protein n=1 Tax=Candidatus Companilactobacillus pullicola TaxID=2838523 RepID=A0A9D1ZN56_9LACO|nr:aromatic compound catabolic protein [Candidatus Companilactobacillus pullicola]
MSLLNDLGIEVVEEGKHKVVLQMDVSEEHLEMEARKAGSINAMLSETAASIGANLNMDNNDTAAILGVSLHNLNSLKLGKILVEAISIRNGSNIQTWQATIHYENSAITNSLSTITLKKIQI